MSLDAASVRLMTRYVASGKQVLRNGGHFADVVSPDGASAIARSMNGTYPHQQRLCFTCKKVDGHEPTVLTATLWSPSLPANTSTLSRSNHSLVCLARSA